MELRRQRGFGREEHRAALQPADHKIGVLSKRWVELSSIVRKQAPKYGREALSHLEAEPVAIIRVPIMPYGRQVCPKVPSCVYSEKIGHIVLDCWKKQRD